MTNADLTTHIAVKNTDFTTHIANHQNSALNVLDVCRCMAPLRNKHVESKRNYFTCGGHMWGQEQKSDCLAHFHYIPWNDGVSLDAVPSCCLACKWCATVFSLSVLIASTVSVFYLTGSSPSPGFSVLVNDNHCLHQRVSCPLISEKSHQHFL